MDQPRSKPEAHRYVSTTMSTNRTLSQRWVNGFKLAFFASILFGLVGLPFNLMEEGIASLVRGQECTTTLLVWLTYGVAALLVYPILFDWLAAVFRIQFVHKAIPRPARRPVPPEAPVPPGSAS